jgi:hypothetical protein
MRILVDLASSGYDQVFTQAEFDEALAVAKAKIMAIGIEATETAILIERQACADLVRKAGYDDLADQIMNNFVPKRKQ